MQWAISTCSSPRKWSPSRPIHGLCNELQEFNLIAFNNSWRECRQLPRMPVIESKAVSTKPCVSGKVQWLWIISSNGAPSWNSRAPRGSAKKFQLYSHVCKAHLHQDDTHKSSSHWTFALAFGFTWKTCDYLNVEALRFKRKVSEFSVAALHIHKNYAINIGAPSINVNKYSGTKFTQNNLWVRKVRRERSRLLAWHPLHTCLSHSIFSTCMSIWRNVGIVHAQILPFHITCPFLITTCVMIMHLKTHIRLLHIFNATFFGHIFLAFLLLSRHVALCSKCLVQTILATSKNGILNWKLWFWTALTWIAFSTKK